MIIVLRHSKCMLTNIAVLLHLAAIELVRGFLPLDPGVSLKNKLSALGTSHMLRGAQNIFGAPVLSRKAWRTELSSSHLFSSTGRS